MKIDEFKKYKQIAESNNSEMLMSYPEAERVYNWMQETGRIDEGFFGAIWSWLKKNFSITARKLMNLADEYEKQALEEGKAEWDRTENKGDLVARYRAGSYAKLSGDIQQRMDIVAGDDEDYRELARTLINKKNMEVKKKLLSDLEGKIDPEYKDELDEAIGDIEKKLKSINAEFEKQVRNLASDKKVLLEKVKSRLRGKLSGGKFRSLGLNTEEKRTRFVQMIFGYVNFLSEKPGSTVKLDVETVEKFSENYARFVRELSTEYKERAGSEEEAVDLVRKALDPLMKNVNPEYFHDLKDRTKKRIEKMIEDKPKGKHEEDDDEDDVEFEVKKKVVTDHSEDFLDDDKANIDKAIKKAAKQADSNKADDIADEIKTRVEKYFRNNIAYYVEFLNKEIEKYKKYPDEKKKKIQSNFKFSIDEKQMKDVDEKDVEKLLVSYLDIVGRIVPYFQLKVEKDKDNLRRTADEFIFVIYAIKGTGEISDDEAEKIALAVRKSDPILFT